MDKEKGSIRCPARIYQVVSFTGKCGNRAGFGSGIGKSLQPQKGNNSQAA